MTEMETETVQYILDIDLTVLYGKLDDITNILVMVLVVLGLIFGVSLFRHFRK